jgi:preprotein translocase subunit SecE
VTEKTAKATKQQEKPKQQERPKQAQRASRQSDRDKPKQPNAIARWWRETLGEMRKVSWPTIQETQRLTGIVLIVMFAMSAILGLLDFLFSKIITRLLS